MEPQSNYNRTPPKSVDTMRQVDIVRLIRMKLSRRIRKMFKDFPTIAAPGSQAPTFNLQTTTGEWINTADYIGKKNLVLEFGAIT